MIFMLVALIFVLAAIGAAVWLGIDARLFWLYLLFLLPLPGTAGLATGFFGALSIYLPSLGAAAFASKPGDGAARPSFDSPA